MIWITASETSSDAHISGNDFRKTAKAFSASLKELNKHVEDMFITVYKTTKDEAKMPNHLRKIQKIKTGFARFHPIYKDNKAKYEALFKILSEQYNKATKESIDAEF